MNFLRRIPLLPTAVSLAVMIASGFAVSPIRDAATLGEVPEVYLNRSLGYVSVAPLSESLDTLTLLSARQHIALLCGLLVVFTLWRGFLTWRRASTPRQHLVAAGVFVGSIVVVYAAGALLPRPMASLGADNANILKVDFHSHTSASHDGHQSVDALRAWHRDAGFDVAYVTDHATVTAAEQGMAGNPVPAGTGVTLLQGVETSWSGEHVSIPGAERDYKGLLTASLADVDTQSLRIASMIAAREPIVIWNHPRDITRLPLAPLPRTAGIRAIEYVNGSPRDMDNVRRNRPQLLEMASGANLSLVAGSDNHGFGYAAPGWTLMLIVDWRGLDADNLGRRIERVIREGRFQATKVVERRVEDPGASRMRLAASVVTVPWRMLTTLSTDERIVWLIWTWVIVLAPRLLRRKTPVHSGS